MLVAVAVAIAAAGMVGAWKLLDLSKLKPACEAEPARGFARVLANKYYVDEVYDALIVKPCLWVSRNVLWKFVDAGVIDGAGVNGSAWTARMFGYVGSAMQTGRLAWYLFVFVIGSLALLRAVMG
jgi:NADH-quinone oxidoreductase subunit L